MKLILLLSLLVLAPATFAADLTEKFTELYDTETQLTKEELEFLRKNEVVLIPGIMAETFTSGDYRSVIDFSILTSTYFSRQKMFFKNHKVKVTRIKASSDHIETTRKRIQKEFTRIQKKKKRAIFITHSLGGMVFLDHLIENRADWNFVAGIIFLQSPFSGAPLASVYMNNPTVYLKPLLMFLNMNNKTIDYLSVERRQEFLKTNEKDIKELLAQIPVINVSSIANGHASAFVPAIDIMKHGCVRNSKGLCISDIYFEGPFDDSDGMVPYENSKLFDADFVKLKGVDHAELILKMPFTKYNKINLTEVLTKMLLDKMQK